MLGPLTSTYGLSIPPILDHRQSQCSHIHDSRISDTAMLETRFHEVKISFHEPEFNLPKMEATDDES
jgi:hypothetical protein